MAKTARAKWKPDDYLWLGLTAALATGIIGVPLYLVAKPAGIAIGALFGFVASAWWSIGIIGKGVEAGNRSSRT